LFDQTSLKIPHLYRWWDGLSGIVNLSEYEGFDKAYIKADEHLYENKRARRSKPY